MDNVKFIVTGRRFGVRFRLVLGLLTILAGNLGFGASFSLASGANAPSVLGAFSFVVVADQISRPVFVTHAKDDRLFLVEQGGTIKVLQNGAVRSTPFLNIGGPNGVVQCCGEEGLLGLAFEPNYASTGRFYVYYTNKNGDQVVARYRVSSSDANVADPGSATLILTIAHPTNGNHNGGWIGFGPDNLLYIAVGDGGGGGDPFCAAQNANDLRGKILRINVVGQSTYTNPPNNMSNAAPEVWAIGLRNPWRASFDRATGDFYVGDVGQDAREEVNFLAAGTAAGTNFGWSFREGTADYSNGCTRHATPALEPFFNYGRVTGTTITGGNVYRGSRYPALNGVYFFADFGSNRIWTARKTSTAGVFDVAEIGVQNFSTAAFGEDSAGELYIADYSNNAIRRIDFLPTRAYLPTLLR